MPADLPQIERFCDFLAEHFDEEDIAAGRALKLDPGGNITKAGRSAGLKNYEAHNLFNQIKRQIGRQAC